MTLGHAYYQSCSCDRTACRSSAQEMNPKPFLAEKDLRNGVQTEFMLANGNSGPLTEAEVAALRCQLPAVPERSFDTVASYRHSGSQEDTGRKLASV